MLQQWAIGFALHNLALAAFYDRDLVRASALVGESASLFRDLQSNASLAEVLISQGNIVRAQGDLAAAYAIAIEALRLALALGPRLMVAMALEALAGIAGEQGQPESAVRLFAPAAVLREQMGTPLWPAGHSAMQQALARTRSTLGDTTFESAWATAAAMPFEQLHMLMSGDENR